MITLEATKQVADDSPDHICPVGAIRDNFTSEGLIEEVKDGFENEQISMLDLGCAGAQFVVDFINRGDIGIGLEGSSNSLGGIGKLNMDSTGSYKYSAPEREQILSRMAERQPWQQMAEIMVNPEYAKQIEDFKYYMKQNPKMNNEKILLKLRLLPFYKAINKVMKNEQRIAEQLSNIGDKYIIDQQYTDKAMKEGNVNKAAEIQTQNLLKYNNN